MSLLLGQYFSQFKPISLKKGELIFRPDFTSHNIFYIESGYVKTYTILENGEEKVIMFYKKNSIIPLTKLFKNSEKNIFAETLTPTIVRSVNENKFQDFLSNNPKAMMELINYFSDYVEVYLHRVENLGFMQSSVKVMFTLLSLANRFGVTEGNNIVIKMPITQREIASTISMTRETFSREFEKLQKRGIVSIENQEIIIKDIDQLIKKMDSFSENDWQTE